MNNKQKKDHVYHSPSIIFGQYKGINIFKYFKGYITQIIIFKLMAERIPLLDWIIFVLPNVQIYVSLHTNSKNVAIH